MTTDFELGQRVRHRSRRWRLVQLVHRNGLPTFYDDKAWRGDYWITAIIVSVTGNEEILRYKIRDGNNIYSIAAPEELELIE